MPLLHIDTNLPRSKIPADFAAKVTPVIAKTLDRSAHTDGEVTECNGEMGDEKLEQLNEFVYPGSVFTRDEKYDKDFERRAIKGNSVNGALNNILKNRLTMVSVTPDSLMWFGGTAEPCARGSIIAIERFSPENNKKFAKIFFDLIQETLGIPADRIFLSFEDVKKEELGYNGVTCAEFLK